MDVGHILRRLTSARSALRIGQRRCDRFASFTEARGAAINLIASRYAPRSANSARAVIRRMISLVPSRI